MSVTQFFTVLGIAVSLAMDAFAVSITQGACLDIRSAKYPLILGLTFGVFQAFMPLAGWALGSSFAIYVQKADHWIALLLLSIVGSKMIYDGYKDYLAKNVDTSEGPSCEISSGGHLKKKVLLAMGVATSIDALAVGFTFSIISINIFYSIAVIGIITFIISFSGVLLGKRAGPFLGDRMEMIGGTFLILLGIKILVEHLIKGI
ncbi:MAG: manganese efflux pump MntP family protein [Sphaerochaetaceae bacterium]